MSKKTVSNFPRARFGSKPPAGDWHKYRSDDPDDNELEETPKDVIRMLGFDPRFGLKAKSKLHAKPKAKP